MNDYFLLASVVVDCPAELLLSVPTAPDDPVLVPASDFASVAGASVDEPVPVDASELFAEASGVD
ncbi:hypothetical protein BBR47_09300 [Brevibacillus brevis NBRC 100599]|uniref:Uncharacterized protein n=1 Tax=Brevibacillus brevis (strain 47 / JCM 6285 / NBRC 100599) TaxID=358681 RepID=C0Z5V0_BREBN|nr:hypothetical protein BBR47_09300 [Brevibacillus brevis NBRC 100599]